MLWKLELSGISDGEIKQHEKSLEITFEGMGNITDEIETIPIQQKDRFFMFSDELRDVRSQ